MIMKFRVISLLLIGVVSAGLFLHSCNKDENCECVVDKDANGKVTTFHSTASSYSKKTCAELETFMNETYGGEKITNEAGVEVYTHNYTCKAI